VQTTEVHTWKKKKTVNVAKMAVIAATRKKNLVVAAAAVAANPSFQNIF